MYKSISRIIVIVTVVILLLPESRAYGANHQTSDSGLSWLIQSKLGNDYWGSSVPVGIYQDELPDDSVTLTSFRDSSQAALTLSIYAPTSADYQNVIKWLSLPHLKSTEFLSRKISALAGAARDTSKDMNMLLSYQRGGFGGYKNIPSNPLDTALALQALKAANYSDATVLYQAINFLTTNQNSDGGWGFTGRQWRSEQCLRDGDGAEVVERLQFAVQRSEFNKQCRSISPRKASTKQ